MTLAWKNLLSMPPLQGTLEHVTSFPRIFLQNQGPSCPMCLDHNFQPSKAFQPLFQQPGSPQIQFFHHLTHSRDTTVLSTSCTTAIPATPQAVHGSKQPNAPHPQCDHLCWQPAPHNGPAWGHRLKAPLQTCFGDQPAVTSLILPWAPG